jgi:hypothetical protein
MFNLKMIGMKGMKQTNKMSQTGIEKAIVSDKAELLRLVEKDGMSLKLASQNLKKDKEVVLRAVSQNAAALQFADRTLQADEKVVAAALQEDTLACLPFVDKSFFDDINFILNNLYGDFWSYMHDIKDITKYFDTPEKVEKLLSVFPDFFGKMDQEYQQNAALFIISLRNFNDKYGYGEGFLENHGKIFTDNEEVMKACYSLFPKETFRMISDRLKHSEEFILELLAEYVDKQIFAEIPKAILSDSEFILNAIAVNKNMFSFIDDSFHKNVVFLQDCLYKNPNLIWDFNEEDILPFGSKIREEVLQPLVVLYMLAENGLLLQELADFNEDKEVVYIALRSNGLALQFVDENIKSDIRFIKWAMKQNPQAIWFADDLVKGHPDLMNI